MFVCQAIPAQILSKGEGPWDNRFYLRGVPLFMIGHFGGSVYADRSASAIAIPTIQYSQPIERHRYLQQIDGYIVIENVVDGLSFLNDNWSVGANIREYYWNRGLYKCPIALKPFGYQLCVRVLARL